MGGEREKGGKEIVVFRSFLLNLLSQVNQLKFGTSGDGEITLLLRLIPPDSSAPSAALCSKGEAA